MEFGCIYLLKWGFFFVHAEIRRRHTSAQNLLELFKFAMTSFVPSCSPQNSQSDIFEAPAHKLWCNVRPNNAVLRLQTQKVTTIWQTLSLSSHTNTHTHTHIRRTWKSQLGKVTSIVKHAALRCRASLPVRHWCGNSHLRVIMGWLAPQVWDPGADSLGWRKRRGREEEEERRYVLSTEGWVTLSTPLTLSVLFPFLSLSLLLLSWLISSTILLFKYHSLWAVVPLTVILWDCSSVRPLKCSRVILIGTFNQTSVLITNWLHTL